MIIINENKKKDNIIICLFYSLLRLDNLSIMKNILYKIRLDIFIFLPG